MIHACIICIFFAGEKEVGFLREALSCSKEELKGSESSQVEIQRHCKEQEGTIAELRAEAQRVQQQCDSGLCGESQSPKSSLFGHPSNICSGLFTCL